MNKKYLIGNWKMNPTSLVEAERLFKEFKKVALSTKNTNTILCVPYPYLYALNKLKTTTKFSLGVQNIFEEKEGAFTGEVSPLMVYGMGATYSIVGHSERRSRGDTNSEINQKIKILLKNKITPILCVGEKARDDKHMYFDFIRTQIVEAFSGISKNNFKSIIVAYEPLWAIGKNAMREASAKEINEMSIFIRKCISDISSVKIAHDVHIIYGGSANKDNIEEFLNEGGVDGFLVGRASLSVKDFTKMMEIVDKK